MVAELFGHSKTRECHRGTCPRRLVHLSIDKGSLTLCQLFLVNQREVPFALFHGLVEGFSILDHTTFEHIAQQVITLTRTLSHSGKHRVSVVSFGDVVDKLHDKHCLTYTGTSEESDFTTLHVGFEQVDNLDTGSQHLFVGRQFVKLRSLAVDRISALHVKFLHTVDRLTDNIHHTALDLVAGRHGDRTSRSHDIQAALQSVGIVHSHTAYSIFTDMLLDLDDEVFTIGAFHCERLINLWEHLLRILAVGIEVYVDNRADNL